MVTGLSDAESESATAAYAALARLHEVVTRRSASRGLKEHEIIHAPPYPSQLPDDNTTDPSKGITLYALGYRKVIRYGNKAVKNSREIRPSEAATMRFIAANTSIPVPQVSEESSETVGGITIKTITMEFIDGQRLDEVWNDLPEEQKLALAGQLKGILSELRSLKGHYIGAIDFGKADDGRRFHILGGPFSTEEDFNEFLLSDTVKSCPKILRDIAGRSLRTDHDIVFTHGDFAPRNILVRDGKVVGLLDWEQAGWYPEHWEFVKSFNAADYGRLDWHNYVGLIFPKCYESEYINDRFLGTLLRH